MRRSARYGCGATSPCTRIPSKEETKGEEASGEAVYLDNRGTNNALTYIYQRDPTERTYLPGPLPPAHVENAEINITAAGTIGMDQGADLAWVEGPGTLTQWTDRGFLTDKSGDPDEPEPDTEAKDGQVTKTGKDDSQVTSSDNRVCQLRRSSGKGRGYGEESGRHQAQNPRRPAAQRTRFR